MKGILGYLREIIGYKEDDEVTVSAKRDRESDDDPPAMKKYRTVPNQFPKVMPKEDDEEWMVPRRIGTAPKERYIPITLEKDIPSTSTPASQTLDTSDLLKTIEKRFSQPSTSSEWTRSLIQKTTEDRELRTNIINPLSREKPSFFRSSYNDAAFLRLKVAPKPWPSEFDLSEIQKPSTSQNRFFKRTSPVLPLLQSRLKEDQADPYAFFTKSSPKESYRCFRSSKKSSDKPADDIEVVEISDSEDHRFYVVKEPKQRTFTSEPVENIEDSDDDDDDEDEEPCNSCKTKEKRQPNIRYSKSPHPKDKTSRFKVPLSRSKAKLINSYTPFWKSQKRLSSSSPKPIGRLKLLENTKAIAERCFRLDDKKKYEELIKLSTGSFFKRSNPNRPSIFTLTDAQKRIQDLTSSFKLGDRGDYSANVQSRTSEKVTLDDGSVVVLSDSDNDQPASPGSSSTSSSVKVVPVNSLKQSIKLKSVASPSWIEELNKKYRNISLDKKQEEEDQILVSTTQSKTNRELWLKFKENHIQSLQIDLTVEEEGPEPLPELTNKQQHIIQEALKPNPPNQVLVQKFNLGITRRDINTLAGLNWLNDEVINFYMNLIMERSQTNEILPKVYAMNTFFYPKLMQSGQPGLRRWTRKVDIFSYHMIVAPIHLGVHWCMSVIDFRKKTIKYFDSMGGKNMECCDALLKYLQDESMDKKQTKFDTTGWHKECVKDIPQQMNGSDCGMFSCTFAEFLSRDAPITFSQNEMPYLRRKMVLEIVQGKLLL